MIDAYEIGIQLALQDGVSAGLEVIGRELLAVDRAIAATSAELVELTHTAEGATRAVAAATAVRTGALAKAEGHAEVESRTVTVMESRNIAQRGRDATTDSTRDDSRNPIEVAAAPSKIQTPADERRSSDESTSIHMPVAVTSIAPQQVLKPGNLSTVQQAIEVPPMPTVSPTTAPARAINSPGPAPKREVVERERLTTSVTTPAREAASSTAPQPRTSEGAREHRALPKLHASVARAVPRRTTRERTHHPAPTHAFDLRVAEPAAAASAPAGSSLGAASASRKGAHPTERSFAPRPHSHERNESEGGVVMLDGRLVGYWLTEHIAREAARPPSGTSFFDPRQTPAWTPSGAI